MAFNKDLLSNKQSDVFVSPRNPNTTVVKEAEKVAKEAKKKAKPSLIDQLTNGSFNPGEIKEKPGYGGQSIKYADRAAVIHQMNRIFEYKWDFEVISIQDIIVDGIKTGTTAICKITVNHPKMNRSIMEIGQSEGKSPEKAAVSDALKRCSSILIGFYNDMWRS